MKSKSEFQNVEAAKEYVRAELAAHTLDLYTPLLRTDNVEDFAPIDAKDENYARYRETVDILRTFIQIAPSMEDIYNQIVHLANYNAGNSAIPEFKAFAKYIVERNELLASIDSEKTIEGVLEHYKKYLFKRLEVTDIRSAEKSPIEEVANNVATKITSSNDFSVSTDLVLSEISIVDDTAKTKEALNALYTQSSHREEQLSDAKKAQLAMEDLHRLENSLTANEVDITAELKKAAEKSAEFVKANSTILVGSAFIASAASVGTVFGGPLAGLAAAGAAAAATAAVKGAAHLMDVIKKDDKKSLTGNDIKIAVTKNDILQVSEVALHSLVITNNKVQEKLPSSETAKDIDKQKELITGFENKLAQIEKNFFNYRTNVSSPEAAATFLENRMSFSDLSYVSEVDFSKELFPLAPLATEARALIRTVKAAQQKYEEVISTRQTDFDYSNLKTIEAVKALNAQVQREINQTESDLLALEGMQSKLKTVTAEINDDIQLRAKQHFAANKEKLARLIESNVINSTTRGLSELEQGIESLEKAATTAELLNLDNVDILCRHAFSRDAALKNNIQEEIVINQQTAKFKKVFGAVNTVLKQINTVAEKTKNLPARIKALQTEVDTFQSENHPGLENLAEGVLNATVAFNINDVPSVDTAAANELSDKIALEVTRLKTHSKNLLKKLKTSGTIMKDIEIAANKTKINDQIKALYALLLNETNLQDFVDEFDQPKIGLYKKFKKEAIADLAAANLAIEDIDLDQNSNARKALIQEAISVIGKTTGRFQRLYEIIKTCKKYEKHLTQATSGNSKDASSSNSEDHASINSANDLKHEDINADIQGASSNNSEDHASINSANDLKPEEITTDIIGKNISIGQKIKCNSHVSTIIATSEDSITALETIKTYVNRPEIGYVYDYNRNDNMGIDTRRNILLNLMTGFIFGIARKIIHLFKEAEGTSKKRKIDRLAGIAETSDAKRQKHEAHDPTLFGSKRARTEDTTFHPSAKRALIK